MAVVAERELDRGARFSNFLQRINREDLEQVVTPATPWVYYSAEFYFKQFGFTGDGGLGILAADTALIAKRLGIPFMGVTMLHPVRLHQRYRDFRQELIPEPVKLQTKDYRSLGEVTFNTRADNDIPLWVYQSREAPVVGLFNESMQELYAERPNSDKRLFQIAALGFGGFKALRSLGVEGSMNQLNEAAAVFPALARLDYLCREQGLTPQEGLEIVRADTFGTNHTLKLEAVATFTKDQLDHFVMPNLTDGRVESWFGDLVGRSIGRGHGGLNLAYLMFELTGRVNGVSEGHAREASKIFTSIDGGAVNFAPVTNAVDIDRWVNPKLVKLYEEYGLFDESRLPNSNMAEVVNRLDREQLKEYKVEARAQMVEFLKGRVDQYGQVIVIPEGAVVGTWAKRFADYKRPGMLFEDVERLAKILEDKNAHILISGKVHSTGTDMQNEMERIFRIIDGHPVLKARVHAVEDYDEEAGFNMINGSDFWFNVPETRNENNEEINTEACGTSIGKAIAALDEGISTNDGFVKDKKSGKFIRVEGRDDTEELESLYQGFEQAIDMAKDKGEDWEALVKGQLVDYLPIMLGGTMMQKYLNFALPRNEQFSFSNN